MTPTRARVGDTVRILVQGFQVSIPIHPHCCGATPCQRTTLHPHQHFMGLAWWPWVAYRGPYVGAPLSIWVVPRPCSSCEMGFAHCLHPSDSALSPHRMKSSPSPSLPGPGWGAGSSMAAPSTMARSWCWSGCRPSSTAPCTAALPRTPWAPPTPTPGSSFLVRWHHGGGHPSLHKSSVIFPPIKLSLCYFFPIRKPKYSQRNRGLQR